ncbi:MAG TPA: DUF2934 domain-containing protein [Tepidisphaeraceae bacterium]|nr:DUF2934 domain-containing protein [Tepidisphaeraceae bacterium]
MSRQSVSAKSSRPASPTTTTSGVRNSAIPKVSPAPKAVTYEMIAKRAYEISQSSQCGSEFDNWIRAERELKAR